MRGAGGGRGAAAAPPPPYAREVVARRKGHERLPARVRHRDGRRVGEGGDAVDELRAEAALEENLRGGKGIGARELARGVASTAARTSRSSVRRPSASTSTATMLRPKSRKIDSARK